MLRPIISHSVKFNADAEKRNPYTGEYNDPLMRWPLRGAAFTNEIGEALRPLIGKFATLTWAPALLYIGADVYDKYKNDQTEYSPDSRRCLKQAIFQGLASILLPIVAVKGGQNLFSFWGMATKDKVTYNGQEQIINIAKQFVANGRMKNYENKDAECIKDFLYIVDNNLDYRKYEESATNPFKEGFYKKFKVNTKENIDNYAKKIITDLINIRKSLLNNSGSVNNARLFQEFESSLKAGQTKSVAVKSVLNSQLINKTMKGRFIKTIGGFLALGFSINPIDRFVEEELIGKIIGPGIDNIRKRPV